MAVSDTTADAGPGPMAAARLRLHAAAMAGGLTLSLLAGVILLVLAWGEVATPWLVAWGAALLAALGLRLLVNHLHRRAGPAADPQRWLARFRASYLVHGLVWAAPALSIGQPADPQQVDIVALGLVAVIGGALAAAAFDRRAALLFALPILLPLLPRLFGPGRPIVVGLIVLLFLAVMVMSARRTDAARRELADQHRLLAQLLKTTPQGFWSIDNDGIGTDVNAAMCELLGRPREQIVGRSVLEFFSGADLERLRAEMAARERSLGGSYEVTIVRPDGTRRHCRNSATPVFDASGRRVGAMGLWTDLTDHVQAQASLRVYERVTNAITDLVSVVDEDHVYRMVNTAWCQRTGLAREQALGQRAAAMFPALASPERHAALDRALAQQQVQVLRSTVDLADRGGRVVETSFYPGGRDGDGRRLAVVVSRDVDAEARALAAAQASEAEQRALLDAFPGYIARLDLELRYSYVNERLAGLFGKPVEQVIGRSVRQLFGNGREAVVGALVTRVLAGEPVTFERHHAAENGQGERDMQITLARGLDPASGQPSIYAFGVDITELKQTQAALTAARDEAERANQAKSRFLSQMSHELRTPMNAILGFAQLLDHEPQPPLAPAQQAQVREILRGARHLLDLINEVLDLGRIEAGQLQVERLPLALPALAEECLGLMQPLARQHGVTLRPPPRAPLEVIADRLRLRQVLLNLLANAIKYNRSGGEVELGWTVEAGRVTLSVRDDGPGLSAEQQQRLFQPFERLNAERSGVEGTGIGLALSRRLVEAMGGEIGVWSEPGAGCRFWVRLPQAGAAAPAVPLLETATAAAARADSTVLYIEDNPVNVVLMQAMLERVPGLRLLTSAVPAEGLALALRERPALVLLDIQMPGLDGFEVLARLRADPATRDTPAIAVSANARQVDIDAALAAGFAAYLTKPLDLDQLLATVHAALAPAG